MASDIQTVVDDGNLCGEAPVWDARKRRLYWTDISSSRVYQWDGKGRTVISQNLTATGIALHESGALIFVGPSGIHLWSGPDIARLLWAEHDGEALSFNDIVADSQGRVYAGTCYWGPQEMEKTGKLYLFSGQKAPRIVDEGLKLSNGLGLSPAGDILYHADSTSRVISAYDVNRATGDLSGKRVFVRVPSDEGIPDGLTVDADGHVWSAQWYGGQIVRYDPDGLVERRIALPVKQISSLAFGGPDFTDLYVTSAAESWPSRYAPPGYDHQARNLGGALYRILTEISGCPEHRARIGPLEFAGISL